MAFVIRPLSFVIREIFRRLLTMQIAKDKGQRTKDK